ncbi:hypothetical protein RRF57_000931 [Xylaria bambusicola]|uniref:RRM domain-containing protein n=1 Tax=Xylaria bambusicola TaxID=326684 RepID=A0AAN7U497_9PEZI
MTSGHMTDDSPQVRATAHLDLVSPAPVHPPSPIVVPVLQDQADTYSNFRSRGNDPMVLTPAVISEMPKLGAQACASQVPIQLSSPQYASCVGQLQLEASGSDKSASILDKRAETGIEARNAHVSGPIDVQKNGYSSSEPKLNPDASARSMDIAPSGHGNDPQPNDPIYSARNHQTVLGSIPAQIPNASSSATCNLAHGNSIPLLWNNVPIYSPHTHARNETVNSDARILDKPEADSNHATPVSLPDSMFLKRRKKEKGTSKNERRGICETKREVFPVGSRVFIGNLSASVRQKDISEIFSKYGHIEEISLKKESYGFVQYPSATEAQAAINHLNGRNIGGKKINLEVARGQNKNGDGNRGSRAKHGSNRHNGNRRRQDDRRSKRRSSPPQLNPSQHTPDDTIDRGRSHQGSNYSNKRHRSKSPRVDDHDLYTYRQRSLSPYRQHRRGAEISDVHILLGDVSHGFLTRVTNEFVNNGLSVGFSSLDSRLGHHEAIQRLVVEGVRAVVVLDYHVEKRGLVSLDLFDRQDRVNNVRFDQYRDLPPDVIARIILSRRPQVHHDYHHSQQPPVGHPSTYVPPFRPNQNCPRPASPGMKDYLRDPAIVQNLLATLGSAPQALGGHLPPHPMPHLTQGVPQAGDSHPQLQNVLTQLTRPW